MLVDNMTDAQLLENEHLLEGKKILIVDDIEDCLIITKLFLSKTSANTFLASNAEEALKIIESAQFDLILMDMQMPGMDGYTATAKLRGMGVEVPIIAITGRVLKEDEDRCYKAGCSLHLGKPFSRAELIRSICQQV